jgi:hypothetical protein
MMDFTVSNLPSSEDLSSQGKEAIFQMIPSSVLLTGSQLSKSGSQANHSEVKLMYLNSDITIMYLYA